MLCCGLFAWCCANFAVLWLVAIVLSVNVFLLWHVSIMLYSFYCVVACFCCVVLILLCCGLFALCCVNNLSVIKIQNFEYSSNLK